MNNYGYAKGNPSGKNQFREDSCYTSSFHRHLGTGGYRNRIRHKLEFKKKPPWFKRVIAKNTQMPRREHKVCKSEWTPTLSKGYSEAADPNPPVYGKRTFAATSSAQDCEEILLSNPGNIPGCSTLFEKSLESTRGGRSCSWIGTNSKDAPGTDTECITGPLSTAGLKPWGTRLEVSGMGQTMQTASWKNGVLKEPRHWNCLGNLTGFGAWSNWENGKEIKLQTQELQKSQQDLTWERLCQRSCSGKTLQMKASFPGYGGPLPLNGKSSDSALRFLQPMTCQATRIWSPQPLKQENWHDLSWFYRLSFWK